MKKPILNSKMGIIRFFVILILSLSILLIMPNMFKEYYYSSFVKIGNQLVYKASELWGTHLIYTNIKLNPATSEARADTIYYDRRNADGTYPSKFVVFDMFIEYYVAFALLLSLMLAIPIKTTRKLLLILYSQLFLSLFLSAKMFSIVLGYYDYPEFVFAELPLIFKAPAYAINLTTTRTGASTNFVIPMIIFIVFALREREIFEFFYNKSEKI